MSVNDVDVDERAAFWVDHGRAVIGADDDLRQVDDEIEAISRAYLNVKHRIEHLSPSPERPMLMLLWCPECGQRHVDVGEFATKLHHTHACQHCGHVWRPAIGPTCGVQFLPGFKNEESSS